MKAKRKKETRGGKRPGAGRPKKFGDVPLSNIQFWVPTKSRVEITAECNKVIDRYRKD